MNIPRQEYPRPQLSRNLWVNLNGEWEFEIDETDTGKEKGFVKRDRLNGKIIVPFCPESELSGVNHKDFMKAVWYKRSFELPQSFTGKRVLLHFGAVDYFTEVWVNGKSVGTHMGGYSSFTFDITEAITGGNNTIVLYAKDDNRSGLQPRGKQSTEYYSHGCDYTRTTGIWQTVWLEAVNDIYIKQVRQYPDYLNGKMTLSVVLNQFAENLSVEASAYFAGKQTGYAKCRLSGIETRFELTVDDVHLWNVGEPNLYDLKLSVYKEQLLCDEAKSYFGLRNITVCDNKILINGKAVFQRLVLDQGFYPQGIYTAPDDASLENDIKLSLAMGFNGARLHQKVFEERFLYHADKLGYIVWGETGSWGLDITTPKGLERFLPEWLEILERDFCHPSLVGWCPFNETWDQNYRRQDNDVLKNVYLATKAADPTRPVIDTSGNFHVITDIFDVHDYEQRPEVFGPRYQERFVTFPDRQKDDGGPYMVSEYGGIWWSEKDKEGWGYGERAKSLAEVVARYDGLTTSLLKSPAVCGFCYTQLTDVEQEQNGLYTYDRKPKFPADVINKINKQKANIEE